MRPAALLWGAFVLHRRFPFVKASPLGRGVTEGDGEGKAADGEAPIQRYSYSDKETTYRCTKTLPYRACPLRRSRASSPKGRPFGRGKAANSLQRVHISFHNNRKGVPHEPEKAACLHLYQQLFLRPAHHRRRMGAPDRRGGAWPKDARFLIKKRTAGFLDRCPAMRYNSDRKGTVTSGLASF